MPKGIDVEAVFVTTNPYREGYEVSCGLCGRTAKLPFQPAGKVVICPDCMRPSARASPEADWMIDSKGCGMRGGPDCGPEGRGFESPRSPTS